MIYIYLNGRFGNYLFQVATGLSISNDITLIAPSEKILNEVQIYPSIFGKFPIIREEPLNIPVFQQQSYYYEEIPYSGQNLIIKGDFQAYKYLTALPNTFISIPSEISSYIKSLDVVLEDSVGIHVRRGDYLKLPHRHPFCGKKYYFDSIAKFDKGTQFVVCSDDLKWCKEIFVGDNFYFVESGSALADFFVLAQCKANIISNSTFSWWASFINHDNKRIIAPSRWFGIQLADRTTRDLYLPQTEVVQCHYDGCTFIKAVLLDIKDIISGFLRKTGIRK